MLLLSIHPRFARMILHGEKTFELRRRSPRCPTDFLIVLYATAPERALVGVVRAMEILVGSPEALWQHVEHGCALRREHYRDYYEGTNRAVGIRLADPIPFVTPIPLDRLRLWWPDFRPPRSFTYLTGERVQEVWDHAGICCIGGEAG